MEYPTKIQGIRRKKGLSQCYVNLPLPLAAAIDIQPGEMVEWKVDTRYKLWLIRQRPKPNKRKNPERFFSRIRLSCLTPRLVAQCPRQVSAGRCDMDRGILA